jgi:hypothetical protein
VLAGPGSGADVQQQLYRRLRQTLGANALVRDVSTAGRPVPVVHELTAGDVVMLQVAGGCDTGVDVTVEPARAADIVNVAPAVDGKAAAVVLRPKGHALFHVVETAPVKRVLATVDITK